jgi:O-antigen ligase
MPPNLALALCVILIIALLVIDHRRNENLSSARWIPLIWMIIILSRSVSQWLSLFGYGAMMDRESVYYEGEPLDRAVFGCLIIIGLIIMMRRKIVWSKLLKEYGWLLGYVLYCAISISWSDFPYIALKHWIKEVGGYIMVLIIVTEDNPVETIQWIFRKCGYVLIPLSVLFVKYFPYIGRGYSPHSGEALYFGAAYGKNGLGMLCLIIAFFFVVEVLRWWREGYAGYDKKRKLATIMVLCMIYWLLMMSRSLTSIVCLITGIIVMVILGSRSIRVAIKRPGVLGVCAALFVVGLLITLTTTDASKFILNTLGRDDTLTGRTAIWEKVLSGKTNPIIGVGYESFWLGGILKEWGDYQSQPNQAHNGYLEIYLNLGIIGLFFIGGIFVSYARKAVRYMGPSLYSGTVQLSFLVIFLLYNITEHGFRQLHPMWFIFLLMGFLYFGKSKTLNVVNQGGHLDSTKGVPKMTTGSQMKAPLSSVFLNEL